MGFEKVKLCEKIIKIANTGGFTTMNVILGEEDVDWDSRDYHLTRRKEPGSLVGEEDTDKGIWDNFYHLLGELLCTVDGLELF